MIMPYLGSGAILDSVKDSVLAISSDKLKSGATSPYTLSFSDASPDLVASFANNTLNKAQVEEYIARNRILDIPLNIGTTVATGWSSASTNTTTFTVEDGGQKIDITANVGSINSSRIYTSELKTGYLAGETVSLNCDVKTLGNIKASIAIDFYSASDVLLTQNAKPLSSYSDYTTVNVTAIAPPTATKLSLVLRNIANGTTGTDIGTAWFRNATVKKVNVEGGTNVSVTVKQATDQSGNGNHAIQNTAANQPRVMNNGIWDTDENGKVSPYFDGATSVLSIINTTNLDILGAPLMIGIVYSALVSTTQYLISRNLDSALTIQYAVQSSSTKALLLLEGSTPAQQTTVSSIPLSTQKIYTSTFETGVQKGYVDGVASGADGSYNEALTSRPNMKIGARSNNAGGTAYSTYFNGNISEIIISISTVGTFKLIKNQSKRYQIALT